MDKYTYMNFQALTDELNKRKITITPEMVNSDKGRAAMRKALRAADAKKAKNTSSKAPAGKTPVVNTTPTLQSQLNKAGEWLREHGWKLW